MIKLKITYWDQYSIPATTKEKEVFDSWENVVHNIRHYGIEPKMIISIERVPEEA